MNTVATRTTVIAVVATIALAVTGMSFTFGGSGEPQAPELRTPDWFLPIADYYDRNPAITPETDFAKLHFGTGTPDWFAPIAEHYDNNPAITPETDLAELHFGGTP
jgi:hypothetical protein